MKTRLIVLVTGLIGFELMVFARRAEPGVGSPAPNQEPANPPRDPNTEFMPLVRPERAGDYLRGNVTLTGDTVPWDPVPISVTCNGKIRYTTSTDPKGRFMIAPLKPSQSTTVKDDRKPFPEQFVGCTVEAVLPGFDSSPLAITKGSALDNPNIGTIELRREAGTEFKSLSITSASAPKDAAKLFNKARDEWLVNKPDRAEEELQKAIRIYPQYAEAWYQLGKIQERSKPSQAWTSFSKAVAADSKFALPYEHLALLAAQAEKWQELVDVTLRELELNPRGTLGIWYYNALGNYHLRNMNVAEASALKSLSMDPLHVQPNTEQLLGVTLAQKQDFAGALEHLRRCLTYLPPGPNSEMVKQQIAEIEASVPAPK